MAKVIKTDTGSQLISNSYSLWKMALIGAVSGLLFWLLTMLIQKYIINPMYCSSAASSLTCLNSLSISGNIAMIAIAVIGIVAMVMLRMVQPLIIAVAATATLWGLAQWTDGLSIVEIIIWSILVYTLAHILFSWIARYDRLLPVLIVISVVILAARIAVNL